MSCVCNESTTSSKAMFAGNFFGDFSKETMSQRFTSLFVESVTTWRLSFNRRDLIRPGSPSMDFSGFVWFVMSELAIDEERSWSWKENKESTPFGAT
ncbi:hypothetical protein WICPIJ_008628 [Wickerhamomyces pijperi]|uniref:Uncharacterized protein n=1 Tax=Wickerhamomyces pijperi TaxID=599730 RepID=A0A9P8PVV9_WICPI|nr:hypothetical protein WICPIJ_008628 [Wickerhamomyces pijperi]